MHTMRWTRGWWLGGPDAVLGAEAVLAIAPHMDTGGGVNLWRKTGYRNIDTESVWMDTQETLVEHQVVPSGCPWPKVQSAQEL